jgi:hypothetical protein
MKPNLPDLHSILSLFVKFVREAALDKLHGLFQRSFLITSQEKMKMVWHDDEFVEKIGAFLAASQDALNQEFSSLRHSEQFAPLPRGG